MVDPFFDIVMITNFEWPEAEDCLSCVLLSLRNHCRDVSGFAMMRQCSIIAMGKYSDVGVMKAPAGGFCFELASQE